MVLLHSKRANKATVTYFQSKGVRCELVATKQGGLDLHAVLKLIGEEGVHDLWVEAGAYCFNALYAHGLIHRLLLYIAPCRLGEHALPLLASGLVSNGQAVDMLSYQHGKDAVFEFKHNAQALSLG